MLDNEVEENSEEEYESEEEENDFLNFSHTKEEGKKIT